MNIAWMEDRERWKRRSGGAEDKNDVHEALQTKKLTLSLIVEVGSTLKYSYSTALEDKGFIFLLIRFIIQVLLLQVYYI